MSKGGGTQTTSDVKQTTTNLPEWAEPYYKDLLARTGYETSTEYQPYGGQRLAYFSPMEQEAMARTGELGVSGTDPYLQKGMNTASQVADMAGNFMPIQIGTRTPTYRPEGKPGEYTTQSREMGYDPGSLADSDMLAQYQDPYMQQVVEIQKREARRDADIRDQQLGLNAAGTPGALGGYRDAMLRAENEKNLTTELGDIQAQGSQQAFMNAQQAYEADRAARAQAEQFGQSQFGLNMQDRQFGGEYGLNAWNAYEQAKQYGAGLEMQAAQLRQQGQIAAADMLLRQKDSMMSNMLSSAAMLGNMSGQQQSMELERLNAMMGVGGQERGLLQQGLNTGYEDYLRQQAWPREQLAFYSNMLQGAPIQPGSTVTSYGQSPSWGQQLLGSGIAGLGLYGMSKGG